MGLQQSRQKMSVLLQFLCRFKEGPAAWTMPLRRAYFMPPLTLAGPSAPIILFSSASSTSAAPLDLA